MVLWFYMVSGPFYGFSRFSSRLVFHGSRCVFHVYRSGCFLLVPGGFMVPGLVFMIQVGFLSSLIVPSWFYSELSAGGAK